MAQPGRAPAEGASLEVAITNPSGTQWDAVPANPQNGAVVDNGGQVTFHCSPSGGARVYTAVNGSSANVFTGQSNNYVSLNHGNNAFTVASGVNDNDISYCVCGPSDSCTPTSPRETGGYSIQVGNPPEPGQGKH